MKKNHKIWLFRGIALAALLAWMILIFGFSGQEGTESSGISQKVSRWIAQAYNGILRQNLNGTEILQIAEKLEHPVRKAAHMSEFGILSFWFYLVLTSFQRRKWRNIAAVLFSFCYASLDEFHQTFVSGRAGRFSDVCIDTSGAILVMLFVYFLQRCYDRKQSKNIRKNERGDNCGRIR